VRLAADAGALDVDLVMRMRPFAASFIALAADEILATGPAVVGFTTTFMQNVPSLALARRLQL
jgi:hypothetical protein